MIDRADVVVIGSGGLGAATAFHLARRDAGRVVLVDRHELGSQTSPRAAGLVNLARSSDLMTEVAKRAADAFTHFSEDTGQPLDWAQPGSLKVARRGEDADVLESQFARCRRLGLDVKLLSSREAHRLNPFLQPDGVLSVMHVAEDLYFDPAHVAIGFARGAEAHGATLLPRTAVERVAIEDGQVTAVETDHGTIRTQMVVDAAGAWTRQVAAASGIRIPLVPTRHQLFVTEAVDGVHRELPIVRIIDAAVYVRPCDGGLLWGGYEEDPRQFDMDDLAADFGVDDLELDGDVLRRLAADCEAQLPILGEAAVREHRGGLPTMTADGLQIVGPVPDAGGFFVAGGCNVGGLSISPAVGEAVAAWIVDGEPPLDLTPLSITRFAGDTSSEDELRRATIQKYRNFYTGH